MANRAVANARNIGLGVTYTVSTPGDGNCFYHAIVNQIQSRTEVQLQINPAFTLATHYQI